MTCNRSGAVHEGQLCATSKKVVGKVALQKCPFYLHFRNLPYLPYLDRGGRVREDHDIDIGMPSDVVKNVCQSQCKRPFYRNWLGKAEVGLEGCGNAGGMGTSDGQPCRQPPTAGGSETHNWPSYDYRYALCAALEAHCRHRPRAVAGRPSPAGTAPQPSNQAASILPAPPTLYARPCGQVARCLGQLTTRGQWFGRRMWLSGCWVAQPLLGASPLGHHRHRTEQPTSSPYRIVGYQTIHLIVHAFSQREQFT